MGAFGIRGSYGSAPDAAALREIGPGVEWVSLFCYSFDQLDAMLAAIPPGVRVFVPVNNEWQEVRGDWSGWAQAMDDFAPRFKGRVHIVGCGNELDLWHWQPPIGKPQAHLTPEFAANLVNVAAGPLRAAGIKVAMSSVASGRWPDYLREMADGCRDMATFADLHLYVKRIDNLPANPDWQEAQDALNVARDIAGLPVLSSEAGIKVDDAGGEDAQAEWGRRLVGLSRVYDGGTYCPLILFAYADGVGTDKEQGGQAFGMIAPDGRRKPLWREVQKACGGPSESPVVPPTPPLPEPPTQITSGPHGEWIGSGLLRELNRRGWTPLRGEEQARLACAEGELVWTGQDARALKWEAA